MKIRTRVVVVIILVVLFFLLIFSMSSQPHPKEFATNRTFETRSDLFFNYEITRYPSNTEISVAKPTQEKYILGVVIDPWNLDFGIIPAGDNFGTRFIDLTNLKEKDVKIYFKVYGNISAFVNFSKNNFILRPEENITVETHFYASSAEVGNYSGEIDVIAQRPKYDFLYSFGDD